MEQRFSPLAVEKFQESTAISALILPRERDLSLEHAQRGSFLIMEQCCGPLYVEFVAGNTVISAPILPRERELSLAHEQRCSFQNKEQSCGPLPVEIFPEKHGDFSTKLTKRARAQSGAFA
jgi:hypothetical protein